MRLFALSLSCVAVAVVAAASSIEPATFNKDVLPVLQKNCQGCHRPGEVAPMSFLTYRETRPWAKAMKAAVLSRKMPPWFADAQYGHFQNQRGLTEAETKTLVSWADNGAPEGDLKGKPAPVQFMEGWNIKPDVTIAIPNPFEVPASGIVEYQYIVVPTRFEKDVWVTAAEVRPGNRAVMHHGAIAGPHLCRRHPDVLFEAGGNHNVLVFDDPGRRNLEGVGDRDGHIRLDVPALHKLHRSRLALEVALGGAVVGPAHQRLGLRLGKAALVLG